nr:unnamed protein product [Digitaria exilis]
MIFSAGAEAKDGRRRRSRKQAARQRRKQGRTWCEGEEEEAVADIWPAAENLSNCRRDSHLVRFLHHDDLVEMENVEGLMRDLKLSGAERKGIMIDGYGYSGEDSIPTCSGKGVL